MGKIYLDNYLGVIKTKHKASTISARSTYSETVMKSHSVSYSFLSLSPSGQEEMEEEKTCGLK